MAIQAYQAIIFDLDGTLLDTLADLAAAGNHTLSALGFRTHPVQEYRWMVGNGIPRLVERMLPPEHRGPATQQVALSLFGRYYSAHKADATAAYPGIPQLLSALKKAGRPMGVVSNKDDALVRAVVEQYFPGVFAPEQVFGRRDGTPAKPDPTLVNTLRAGWGLPARAVLYAGDSNVDVMTAKAAGLDSCGVLWGFRTRTELEQAGATYLAAQPGDLAALLGLGTSGGEYGTEE